jgi:deoxyribonuclease V
MGLQRPSNRHVILSDVDTGGGSGKDLFVAADVHYLAAGGARAAAVVSTDSDFSHLVADRVELVPEVQSYQPGQFYLRELPPLHAALDGLAGMALLVVDGYVDLDPDGRGASARPLYVTAAGMPRADAADLVRAMAGRHRMPDALRRVDTLARTGPPAND